MFSQTLQQAPRRTPVISSESSRDKATLTVNPSWHQQSACANGSVRIVFCDRLSTVFPTPSRAAEYDVFVCHCKRWKWYQATRTFLGR
jgi:hypothetical protein